ncbi:unnamed protein product [Cuscuta epithymum]|uniref:Plastid lipid-associated protein/fibrillin conserved domain-containing protein n=1 Tax=Cuscuta epithymum TaxID=186058 RepID=A0AAV0FS38_9ASTE|nr:unnamed protein product [Cuscuta epithymum]
MQRIDVNERIIGLERLNPTPRPTTSPILEGRWNIEWFGSGSPAVKVVLERFPPSLANLSRLDVLIKDSYTNITANLKLLNSIESNFILSAKLSIEGPLRMKEEYVEGILESPKVNEETVPQVLRGVFGQAMSSVQQLPVPVRNAVSSGLKIPLGEHSLISIHFNLGRSIDNRFSVINIKLMLFCHVKTYMWSTAGYMRVDIQVQVTYGGSFQRLFIISYLDEDILIIRDSSGLPEVLTRSDSVPEDESIVITEFES